MTDVTQDDNIDSTNMQTDTNGDIIRSVSTNYTNYTMAAGFSSCHCNKIAWNDCPVTRDTFFRVVSRCVNERYFPTRQSNNSYCSFSAVNFKRVKENPICSFFLFRASSSVTDYVA